MSLEITAGGRIRITRPATSGEAWSIGQIIRLSAGEWVTHDGATAGLIGIALENNLASGSDQGAGASATNEVSGRDGYASALVGEAVVKISVGLVETGITITEGEVVYCGANGKWLDTIVSSGAKLGLCIAASATELEILFQPDNNGS